MYIVRLLFIIGMLSVSLGTPAYAVQLAIACGAEGQEFKICKEGAEAWAYQTGNTVTFLSSPNSSSEKLALYQQFLAAQDASVDVFQIDVIWLGILRRHFMDLKPYVPESVLGGHFPNLIANNTVDGHLIAMPWFVDAGLLYYRQDLLEKYHRPVPNTWEELEETAHTIQEGERKDGNPKFWGFVWQGRAFEGLTCNALEWVESFGGGSIVEPDGKISINNPQAVKALQTAASWINTISPKGVLNYSEEETRGVFQSGNAAFMRNWPYVWQLIQSGDSPVKDKVGIAILPAGSEHGKHIATLGGWELGVSKYSRHPKEAIDLVLYLTSAPEQKRRAIAGTFNPTIMALYQNREILQTMPFLSSLYEVFANAGVRPSTVTGKKYNQVSSGFWNAVHETLSGSQDAASSLRLLETRLDRISHHEEWEHTNGK